jgi:hypothetical protein
MRFDLALRTTRTRANSSAVAPYRLAERVAGHVERQAAASYLAAERLNPNAAHDASPLPLGAPALPLRLRLFGLEAVFAVVRVFVAVFFTGIRAAIFDAASHTASSTTFRAKRASFLDMSTPTNCARPSRSRPSHSAALIKAWPSGVNANGAVIAGCVRKS